jgi:hypothetical protein
MRELTNEERIVKVVHVAQKWLEQIIGNSSLEEAVLELAFLKATEISQQITHELQFNQLQEEEWVETWVQIGIFAGFISGCNAFKFVSKSGQPVSDAVAFDNATQVAYKISDKVIEHLTSEPKSVLVSGLHETQIAFIKEALERSLFSGYLEGIEYAGEISNKSLASLVLDPTIEV